MKMKTKTKNLMAIVVVLCMAVIWTASGYAGDDFQAPANANYGVTEDGVFFISEELIKDAGGDAPKMLSGLNGLNWVPKRMELENGYYIYRYGKRVAGAEFCFDIGGGSYLPHALVGDSRISHYKDNGQGGYNFRMKALK